MQKLAQWLLLGAVVALASLGVAGAMVSALPPVDQRVPVVLARRHVTRVPTAVRERAVTPLPPTPTSTPTPTPTVTAAPTSTPTSIATPAPSSTPTLAYTVPAPAPPPTATSTAVAVPTPRPPRLSGLAAGLFAATNRARAGAGLPALSANRALIRSAEDYAALMARFDWFDHTGPDGSTVASRARDAAYTGRWLGEVLFRGSSAEGPREIVDGWLSSPPHAGVVLGRTFEDVGIGCAMAEGLRWCVEEFGGP